MQPLHLMTLGVALLLALPATGPAGEQDDVRGAVARGEMRPLSAILAQAEREFGGRVLEVEVERRAGVPVYEVELVTADGRVLEVLYDSTTGERLAMEEEDPDD